MEMFIKCREISREVWEEREYKFEKSANLAKCDFEPMVRQFVGWDEEVEMEIKFTYICNDTIVYVLVRERID